MIQHMSERIPLGFFPKILLAGLLMLAASSVNALATSFDEGVPEKLSRGMMDALQTFPKKDEFFVSPKSSGMTGLSSFTNFTVKNTEPGARPAVFLNAYRDLLASEFAKSGVESGNPNPFAMDYGVRGMALKTKSGKRCGTVSIVSWKISDSEFGVNVAAALSP